MPSKIQTRGVYLIGLVLLKTWTLEMDGALIAYAAGAQSGVTTTNSLRLEDLLDDEADASDDHAEEGIPPPEASTPDRNALRREVSAAPRFTKADVAVASASPRGAVRPTQTLRDNSKGAIRGRFLLLKAWTSVGTCD